MMRHVDWFYGGPEIRAIAEELLKDVSMKPIHLRSIPIQSSELSIVELANAVDGKLVYVALYKDRVVTAQVTSVITDQTVAAQTLAQFSLLNKLRTYPHIRHIVGAGYLNEQVSACKILVLFENVDDSAVPFHTYLKGEVTWENRITIAKSLALVLHELHERHITHSDLSMTEIFLRLEQDNSIVLSESITCASILSTADNIYSLGGILLFLILNPSVWVHTEPTRRLSKMQHVPVLGTDAVGNIGSAQWIRHYIEQLQHSRNKNGLILNGCPERLQQIILWCCEDNPADRPTAADCVNELQAVLSQLAGAESSPPSAAQGVDELLPSPPPPRLPQQETHFSLEGGATDATAAAAASVEADLPQPPLPPPPMDSDDDEEPVIGATETGPIWNARRQSALALGPAPAVPQTTIRRESLVALGPPPPLPSVAREMHTAQTGIAPAADRVTPQSSPSSAAEVFAAAGPTRAEEEVMVIESHRPAFSSVTPKSAGRRVSFLNFPDEAFGKPPVPWGTEGTGQLLDLEPGTDDVNGQAGGVEGGTGRMELAEVSSAAPLEDAGTGHPTSNHTVYYQEQAYDDREEGAQPLDTNLPSHFEEEGEEFVEEEMAQDQSQNGFGHDVYFGSYSSRSTEYELPADGDDNDEEEEGEEVYMTDADGMEANVPLPPTASHQHDVHHQSPPEQFDMEPREVAHAPPPPLSIRGTLQKVQRVLYDLLVDLDQDIDGLARLPQPLEMVEDEAEFVQQIASSLEVLRKQMRYIDVKLMGNPSVATEATSFEADNGVEVEVEDGEQQQQPAQNAALGKERAEERMEVQELEEQAPSSAPPPASAFAESNWEQQQEREGLVVETAPPLAAEPMLPPVQEPPEQEPTPPQSAPRAPSPVSPPGCLMLVAFAREAASSGLQSVHWRSDKVDMRSHYLLLCESEPREGYRQTIEMIDVPARKRPPVVEQVVEEQEVERQGEEEEQQEAVPEDVEDAPAEGTAAAVMDDSSVPTAESKLSEPEPATMDEDRQDSDSGPTTAPSAPRSALAAAFSYVPQPSPLLASIPQYAPLQGLRAGPTSWEDDASTQDGPPPSDPDDSSARGDYRVVSGDAVTLSPATIARVRMASPQNKIPTGLQCADRFVQQIQQLDRAYNSAQASLTSVFAVQGPSQHSPSHHLDHSAPNGHSAFHNNDNSSASGTSGMYSLRYRSSPFTNAAHHPPTQSPGVGRSLEAFGADGFSPNGMRPNSGSIRSPPMRDGHSVDAFTAARYSSNGGMHASPQMSSPAAPAAPFSQALQSFASVINKCEVASQRAHMLLQHMDSSLSVGASGEPQPIAAPGPQAMHVTPKLVLQTLQTSTSSNRSVSSFSSGVRTPSSSGKLSSSTPASSRQAARVQTDEGVLPLSRRRCSAIWAERLSTTHTANSSKRK